MSGEPIRIPEIQELERKVLLSCFSALKSHDSNKYYINGNWVIDLPKGYNVAGTTVYYSRPRRNKGDEEALIAEGPTTEDLDVMVRAN